jgi:RND family efflux transporter MFP subunit
MSHLLVEPIREKDLSRLRINKDSSAVSTPNESPARLKLVMGVLIALVFVAGVFFLVGVGDNSSTPAVTASGTSEGMESANFSKGENPTSQVASQPLAQPILKSKVMGASGYVVAQRKASVASKATGRLKELRVVEGDSVKAGDILGILENDDLQAIVMQAEANVALLESRVALAEAELENATAEYNRSKVLLKEDALSKSVGDATASRYKKSVAELGAAKSSLEVGRSQLEKVRVDLEYTKIVAPFDGTVLTKDADVGEIVAPFGSSSTSRAAIVTLADLKSLQVEADVSESNLSKVRPDQKVEIKIDSFPGVVYTGRVTKIVPTVDRAKGTVLVKISFDALDEKVLPEMSAKVNFILEE